MLTLFAYFECVKLLVLVYAWNSFLYWIKAISNFTANLNACNCFYFSNNLTIFLLLFLRQDLLCLLLNILTWNSKRSAFVYWRGRLAFVRENKKVQYYKFMVRKMNKRWILSGQERNNVPQSWKLHWKNGTPINPLEIFK